ncbi:hypothetical protein ALI44B_01365 [Leifsonia sp. ALI-44-B]|uniref:LA2681 family HEPN domain-containing protein n=1 Tax=Leifsonia sp. ALI-44-B TaxID=1933776 RepID=UPI00097C7411|nr:LA2681 family HEPN domain-containing protein [Leifsonia sp. ALI-44-B]ONI63408.1 hypothetical protein ALI44B_01365 [Leifsonia sp. ALI-44-B]
MASYSEWHQRIIDVHDAASDAGAAAQEVLRLGRETYSDLSDLERAGLRFTCSSLAINTGATIGDVDILSRGKELARGAQRDVPTDHPLHFQCMYNVANATLEICDLGMPTNGPWEEQLAGIAEIRRVHRSELRDARRMLHEVGSSPVADSHTRSAAYCNLANCLDHSGRWAEAYDFYLRALDADPSNGNAAGNLAKLLMNRVISGVGQTGHLAAVHDKYAKLARLLRTGTIAFAGEETAARWDDLRETESPGHLAHGMDGPDREYREWVAAHRLALSAAVEGLGTEEAHWDGAAIEILYGTTLDEMSPPILAEMNVLKSDYLVSRRLAFDGYVHVAEGPEQKADDSGFYVETLDYSLYGTQYSRLLLAQRSALDVLDKTAVVANEHFAVGDEARRVSFRQFWSSKDGRVRSELQENPQRSLAALALSELAYDMDNGGMYAPSQALRNAGTHRIVHAAIIDTTGVTVNARSRIDIFELVDSTVLALQATRSAYLYLVDLVAGWNHPIDHPDAYLPFPSYEYMKFPEEPGDNSTPDGTDPAPQNQEDGEGSR